MLRDLTPARLIHITEELLRVQLNGDCTFWACQGYNVRPVSMITCSRCQAVHELRAVLAELNGLAYNTNTLPHMPNFPGSNNRRWRVGVFTIKSHSPKERNHVPARDV